MQLDVEGGQASLLRTWPHTQTERTTDARMDEASDGLPLITFIGDFMI